MSLINQVFPQAVSSPVARAVARAVALGVTPSFGGGAADPDPASDVRNLFTANGGDFTGTMLNFGKTSRLFSDFDGTEAADGDTLALVLDDVGPANGTDNGAASFTDESIGTGTATISGRTADFAGPNTGNRGRVSLAVTGAVGEWVRIDFIATINSGLAQALWSPNAAGNSSTRAEILYDGAATWLVQMTATTMYFTAESTGAGADASVTVAAVAVFTGRAASQPTSGSRPALTTDPFGTLVAQTDGTDDYMDLPDGVLGDGTQAISVSFAIAPNEADSDANARLIAGASGAGFEAYLASGDLTLIVKEGGTANTETIAYGRAVTDNETIIATFQWAPSTAPKILVNGVVVAEGSSAYATLDDPGAPDLFGVGTATSLACTCHGAVSLVGTALPTTTQRETVEAYLADLASDTLLTADADTVLSRWFRPATDLDVTDDFSTDLIADGTYTDTSTAPGTASVSGGELLLTGDSGTSRRGTVRRQFLARVGYRYTVTVNRNTDGGSTGLLYAGTSAGGTQYGVAYHFSGIAGSITFIATQPVVYVQIESSTSGTTNEIPTVEFEETAATGDYWDMLDETRMFSDDEGTLVEAEGTVLTLLPKGRAETYGPELWADPPTAVQPGWVDNGNSSYTIDGATGSDGLLLQDAATIQGGALFRATGVVSGLVSGSIQVRGGGGGSTVIIDENGEFVAYFTVNVSSFAIAIQALTANDGTTVSGVSIKQVLGYPLRQTASASRPKLSYAPNALLQSIAFYGKSTETGSLAAESFLTNGDFSTNDLTGWTDQSVGTGTVDASSGAAVITSPGGADYGKFEQSISCNVGDPLVLRFSVSGPNTGYLSVSGIDGISSSNIGGGDKVLQGVASTTTPTVGFQVAGNSGTCTIDDVSLDLVLPDASGNNAGPIINGTLTRTAVATGANVVAYSGFSGSNYFESADDYFDPGTGDWSITRVAKDGIGSQRMWEYAAYSGGYTGVVLNLSADETGSGGYRASFSDDSGATADAVSGGAISATGQHDVITVARRGSTFELWVNGTLVDSTAVNAAVGSLSGGKMRTGQRFAAGQTWIGSISSIMLDANYAPTEAEITALHADLAAIHSGENADFSYGRLVYDGTDDFMEAVDPDADLAITGDLTVLIGAAVPNSAAYRYLVSSGDPASATGNVAYAATVDTSEKPAWQQASTVSLDNLVSTLVAVGDRVITWRRNASPEVEYGVDAENIDTDATTVTPSAGSSPVTKVGTRVDDGSGFFDGSSLALAVIDRALSTGLLLHAERALGEKIE